MRAVRLHGVQDLRVEEIAAPAPPGPAEVTLRGTAAGICGSDLHNFRTGAWISRAPSVAGHEFTGVVTAVGADVRHVAPGDRVLVDSQHVCGVCAACRAGLLQRESRRIALTLRGQRFLNALLERFLPEEAPE